MQWQGQWIWGQEESLRNDWRYFRKELAPLGDFQSATIHITADSAYEVYINGFLIGRGPARGYPFHYFYDTYEILPYIASGKPPVIGIIAQHMGDHSMCYVKGRAGLLCDVVLETKNGQIRVIGTDSTWQTLPYSPINQNAPRISKQLEFEEHYDARLELDGWNLPDFDTTGWQQAQVIGPAGIEPWKILSSRDIPPLTETATAPAAVLAVELAQRTEGVRWNFDLRRLAGTDEKGLESALPGKRGWIVFSEIFVDEPCEARIRTYPDYEFVELRVNDQTFRPFDKFHPKTWTVKLHKGPNLIMMRNVKWPAIFIEADQPFKLSAERALQGAVWVFSGVFDERHGELERRWNVTQLEDLPADDPRVALTEADNRLDIFVETTSQRFLEVEGGFCHPSIKNPQPREKLERTASLQIANVDALLYDNSQWTEIYPHNDGDVHLVIDFGREVVGYLELEIDAPEGVVLDANCFEAVDDLGIYWMGSMRNTFRYTCREGLQTWRSHRRRGFRYMSLTIRHSSHDSLLRPIKIRHVSLYSSTYPVHHVGSFRSSDSTLNQIWETSAYTVQLCMLDTYVDCPGFEQVFWVGDARNSALVNAVAFGAYDLTARCNRLVADSLSHDMNPIIPEFYMHREHITASHVVSGWFDEIPMWTFLWVWMVWEHYFYTGDSKALCEIYPAVKECLRRAETMLSERDLFAIDNAWNMMDHAANDNERYGEIIGNSVMFKRALDVGAWMANELHDETFATYCEALSVRIYRAVNQFAWSEKDQSYVDTVRDSSAYNDYLARCERDGLSPIHFDAFENKQRISEQTNTLALLCKCVPPERYEAALKFVRAAKNGKFIASRTDYAYLGSPDQVVSVGSPWFLFFTLETLFAEGCSTEAFTIIREQWKKMLDKGATTFWETFPGDVSKGHWSRSMCHGWSSAPAYFISTQLLGVQPLESGFKRIRIAPQPFDLQWAEGNVPTPHGIVYVRWWRDDSGVVQLTYTAPDGCDVEVVLPENKG